MEETIFPVPASSTMVKSQGLNVGCGFARRSWVHHHTFSSGFSGPVSEWIRALKSASAPASDGLERRSINPSPRLMGNWLVDMGDAVMVISLCLLTGQTKAITNPAQLPTCNYFFNFSMYLWRKLCTLGAIVAET